MSGLDVEKYTKITSLEDLAQVSKVLIAATFNRAPAVMSTTYNTNNRPGYIGEFDDKGRIIYSSEMMLFDLHYDAQTNTVLFSYDYKPVPEQTITYYLCAIAGNNNRLRSTTELTSNCYFRVAFDINHQISLTCADETVTRNTLKYNKENNLFACYLPDYNGISPDLYKLYVAPEPEKVVRQNHVIDPTFFFDAILEFAFDYDWFPMTGYELDEMKRQVAKFDHQIINGSLQPQTGTINFGNAGNTHKLTYKFYCKSLYRINRGDFIYYHNRYLHVDEVQEYDEWGVREVSLTMINLVDYRDFQEYIKYLNGEIPV